MCARMSSGRRVHSHEKAPCSSSTIGRPFPMAAFRSSPFTILEPSMRASQEGSCDGGSQGPKPVSTYSRS